MLGKYEVLEGIGYGRSMPRTQVKRGVDTETGEEVALKLVDREHLTAKNITDLEREVESMTALAHKHIVSLRDVIWEAEYPKKDGSSSRSVVCLVLELATGGELFDYIFHTQQGFPEDIARTYFQQLVDALCHVHKAGYAHRDLKPENLVLDGEFNLKVTDMGMSTLAIDERGVPTMLKTQCGTFGYIAPEVLAGLKYTGEPVDVWAAGVVLFLMLAGFPPFMISKKKDEPIAAALANDWWFQRIIHNQHRYFWDAHMRKASFSPDAIALMNKIFRVDPSRRATLADILEDKWFNTEATVAPDVMAAELERRRLHIARQKAEEKERQRREREAARAEAGGAGGAYAAAAEMFAPIERSVSDSSGGAVSTSLVAPLAPDTKCVLHSRVRVHATAATVVERIAQTLSRMCADYTVDEGKCKVRVRAHTPQGEVSFVARVMRERGTDGKADDADAETPTAHVVEVRRSGAGIVAFYDAFDKLAEGLDDISEPDAGVAVNKAEVVASAAAPAAGGAGIEASSA